MRGVGSPPMPDGGPLVKAPRVAQQLSAAQVMMRHNIPVSRILAIVRHRQSLRGENDLTAEMCAKELRKYSEMKTPYGPVRTTLQMPLSDGKTADLCINNPFSLLYALTSTRPEFGDFLQRHTQQNGNQARIVMYSDETRPGNVHRPGHARQYECLQWTFAELPDWFRARKHGWFKLGYVTTSLVDQICGGMPALVKQILALFFSPNDFNFSVTGVLTPTLGVAFPP